MRKLNIKGDTIVEVMISLMILGSVMAAAYAITNFSLNIELSAQERSDALNIAQSQLETLKSMVASNNNNLNFISTVVGNNSTDNFCVVNNSIVTHNLNSCTFSGNGGPVVSNAPSFQTSIFQQNVYKVSWQSVVVIVKWIGLNGVNNKVYLFYVFP